MLIILVTGILAYAAAGCLGWVPGGPTSPRPSLSGAWLALADMVLILGTRRIVDTDYSTSRRNAHRTAIRAAVAVDGVPGELVDISVGGVAVRSRLGPHHGGPASCSSCPARSRSRCRPSGSGRTPVEDIASCRSWATTGPATGRSHCGSSTRRPAGRGDARRRTGRGRLGVAARAPRRLVLRPAVAPRPRHEAALEMAGPRPPGAPWPSRADCVVGLPRGRRGPDGGVRRRAVLAQASSTFAIGLGSASSRSARAPGCTAPRPTPVGPDGLGQALVGGRGPALQRPRRRAAQHGVPDAR